MVKHFCKTKFDLRTLCSVVDVTSKKHTGKNNSLPDPEGNPSELLCSRAMQLFAKADIKGIDYVINREGN